MRKSVLLLFLMSCMTLTYGQETVFLETCGNLDVSTPKRVDIYSGWDNITPVTFSRTTTLDGSADVRITTTTTNHVWFPSGKSSDLIISNIDCTGYDHLLLSFDIAAYKLADANVNKLTILCNDSALILPSTTFPNTKFLTVQDIILGSPKTVTLHFEYTSENNTNGYRLDNFKITGLKSISGIANPSFNAFNPTISGKNLLFRNFSDGTIVDIFNPTGILVQTSIVKEGFIVINTGLNAGLYIVRAGDYCGKILLYFR